VGGFRLDGVAVGGMRTSAEAERPAALRHDVTSHIPVVVLAGSHKAPLTTEAPTMSSMRRCSYQVPAFEVRLVRLEHLLLEDAMNLQTRSFF
jgi:hypothetical protein